MFSTFCPGNPFCRIADDGRLDSAASISGSGPEARQPARPPSIIINSPSISMHQCGAHPTRNNHHTNSCSYVYPSFDHMSHPSASISSQSSPPPIHAPQPYVPQALHVNQGPYEDDLPSIPAYRVLSIPLAPPVPAPPAPSVVEDTPKKPLTLACFFCRKRKIACGSPPPGRKDRTCK